jgi:hypothetical protein
MEFKEDTIRVEVSFDKEAFCEHCMEMEPYTAITLDGWCLWCCDLIDTLPDTLKEAIQKKQKQKQIEYYKKRIKELERESMDV